jgi:hypothetical protein
VPKVCTPAAAWGALLPAVWGLSRARLPGLWSGVAESAGPVLQAMRTLPTALAGQRVCLCVEAHLSFAFIACAFTQALISAPPGDVPQSVEARDETWGTVTGRPSVALALSAQPKVHTKPRRLNMHKRRDPGHTGWPRGP